MAMRNWILFLCNVSLMGLLFTFTWKLLDPSLILEHIREGFSPFVALFWTWERAHRHLASVKSTCKIRYLFKWLMRMQQSVSLDNLEMSVWRQGGCTAWFVLFVAQPNCKMLLCPVSWHNAHSWIFAFEKVLLVNNEMQHMFFCVHCFWSTVVCTCLLQISQRAIHSFADCWFLQVLYAAMETCPCDSSVNLTHM